MNSIRLLALDLDGTILTSDKQVTPRTRHALSSAMEAGVEVVLVTGRPMGGLPRELLDIPGIRYAITSNGAVSTDLMTQQILRSALIPSETALEIVPLPRERDLFFDVFLNGLGYSDTAVYQREVAQFAGTPIESYIRASRRGTDDLPELISSSAGAENIWIRCRNREERDQLHSLVRERWQLVTTLTAITDVEIGAPGADKGQALTELADRLKISQQEFLAIGDNENDLGMLRAAGTAVAMGNSTEIVKALANHVTDSNDRDGAAAAIEKFCLQ